VTPTHVLREDYINIMLTLILPASVATAQWTDGTHKYSYQPNNISLQFETMSNKIQCKLLSRFWWINRVTWGFILVNSISFSGDALLYSIGRSFYKPVIMEEIRHVSQEAFPFVLCFVWGENQIIRVLLLYMAFRQYLVSVLFTQDFLECELRM